MTNKKSKGDKLKSMMYEFFINFLFGSHKSVFLKHFYFSLTRVLSYSILIDKSDKFIPSWNIIRIKFKCWIKIIFFNVINIIIKAYLILWHFIAFTILKSLNYCIIYTYHKQNHTSDTKNVKIQEVKKNSIR